MTASGYSVAAAGDVSRGGLNDLIVGGYSENFVVFGNNPGFAASLDLAELDGGNGFRLEGASAPYSGWSISGAGNVNGDGIDDVIVGAAGESYVVFGSGAGFPANLDPAALNGSNGFCLDGAGASVSAAGDVNGDGVDDLIVGDDGGVSNVFFGFQTGPDKPGTSAAAVVASPDDAEQVGAR